LSTASYTDYVMCEGEKIEKQREWKENQVIVSSSAPNNKLQMTESIT